ncbi:Phosphopantetheine adenylyltransferase [hydrothermal vent metagenome]|uniref:Phosphopantetheine adenylyltransferase n=1 Tax=hydrothermal vent metagenome TaxID=652676 RepID=A0A3B0UR85_9ZZZZ
MDKIALFPGSFDPFTKGHEDILLRGLNIFDKIIIAIGYNTAKHKRYFDVDSMVNYIEEIYKDRPEISVKIYNELTAEFAKKHNANYLLRGLRNTTDFEYENTIAELNKNQNPDLETVFLITTPIYAHISSSIIREVHRYGGDVTDYLPYEIKE